MLIGSLGVALGVLVFGMVYAFIGLSATSVLAGGIPTALGLFVILGGLVAILTDATLRASPRAKVYVRTAYSFPVFFIAVPFIVYMASYAPFFAQGHGLHFWWELNDSAYKFHSSLTATHPYQSAFWKWPLDIRPVFLYLGSGEAKIYNLGNPMVFWMIIPSLFFCAWQAIRNLRIRIEPGSVVRVWGRMQDEQWILAFVVISYVGFWLALSTQGRALFLYHYQEALAFGILAVGYVVGWLWKHPNPAGRYACLAYLAVVGVTFIYFFPHWTAVDVPQWLDSSYYWFNSWR
jgi:dolichyl-phosphate-mannose--protein O-mannosyl transferase